MIAFVFNLIAIAKLVWSVPMQVLDPLDTLKQLVQYVVYGGGSVVIVGLLLSAFGERWAWYQSLDAAGKSFAMKLGSALLGAAVYLGFNALPASWLPAVAGAIGVIVVALGAPAVTQWSHAMRKVNALEIAPPEAGASAPLPVRPDSTIAQAGSKPAPGS